MDHREVNRDRARQLVAYLRAVDQTLSPIDRDMEKGGYFRLYGADLPDHPSVAAFTGESWLRVHRTELPKPCPPAPDAVAQFLVDFTGREPAHQPTLSSRVDELPPDEGFDVLRGFERWRDDVWAPWAESAKRTLAAYSLYRRLFDLRLLLETEQDSIELVLGHGLFTWAVEGESVRFPIAGFAGEIVFDDRTGDLDVRPLGDGSLQLHYLLGLGIGDERTRSMLANAFESDPIGPGEERRLTDLYSPFANSFGGDGCIAEGKRPVPPSRRPTIVDGWVIYARRRAARYQRFFGQLEDAIDAGAPLSAPFEALVADEPDRVPDAWAESERDRLFEDLLFPKPSNREQEQIAQRLARSRGVTVQGPPGTGKTHTIANLVSHLVAHGKRVLVSSQKGQALAVLREQLPEAIRPLCVADLSGAGRKGELQDSIDAILKGIAHDGDAQGRIEDARRRVDESRRRQSLLLNRLKDIHEADAQEYELSGTSTNSRDLAAWLLESEERLGFIADDLAEDAELPVSRDELGRILQLLGEIAEPDRQAALHVLPETEITGAALSSRWERLDQLDALLAPVVDQVGELESLGASSPEELRATARMLDAAASTLESFDQPWHQRLIDEVRADASFRSVWERHSRELGQEISELALAEGELIGRTIDFGQASEDVELLDWLTAIRDKRAADKRLGRLGEDRKRAGEIRIDGRLLGRTPAIADVELLVTAVNTTLRRAKLVTTWNDLIRRVDGPTESGGPEGAVASLQPRVAQLEGLLAWESEGRAACLEACSQQNLNLASADSVDALRAAAETARVATNAFERADLVVWFGQVRAWLEAGATGRDASPSWAELRSAFEEEDSASWDRAHAEVNRLARIAPDASELAGLQQLLGKAAPKWAAKLHSSPSEELPSTSTAIGGWNWRRAESWLSDLLGMGDPAKLQAEIEDLRRAEQQALERLVAELGWEGLRTAISPAHQASLAAFAEAMRQLGKGTGKYAPKWRAQAREAMVGARGAVPVWVMPVHAAIDSFDPNRGERFDVLITDESSQCDVRSISLLALADKVIVVGDDKQIAPAMPGVGLEPVFKANDQLLKGYVPNPGRFMVKSSLYSVAMGAFPGAVMLKEHFRCLPEIIGFSNKLSYEGQVQPLRETHEDASWRPVVDVFLADGYRDDKVNVPEQERIVELVARMCRDSRYDGLTFGVVSLLGGPQAEQISGRLQAALGETEFERRRIRCGDAYHFQGDERDVMLLSLVSDSVNKGGGFTTEPGRQRMNVAASRAKDQMWLVRSVQAADLNHDDVRRHLIEYCSDPSLGQPDQGSVIEKTESPFERLVAERILAAGYRVEPQYQVGSLRIDFVVWTSSGRSRLAVECDGEQWHGPERWEADMARQRTLERLGWKFHRIRGAAFYRNPDKAMAELFEVLERIEAELGEVPEDPEEPRPPVSGRAEAVPKAAASAEQPEPVMELGLGEQAAFELAVDELLPDLSSPPSTPHSEVLGQPAARQVPPALSNQDALAEIRRLLDEGETEAARELCDSRGWERSRVDHRLLDRATRPIGRPDRKRVSNRAAKKRRPATGATPTRERSTASPSPTPVPNDWVHLAQALRQRFADVEVSVHAEATDLAGAAILVRCLAKRSDVEASDIKAAHDAANGKRSAVAVQLGVGFGEDAMEWAAKYGVGLLRLNERFRPVAVSPAGEALLRDLQS